MKVSSEDYELDLENSDDLNQLIEKYDKSAKKREGGPEDGKRMNGKYNTTAADKMENIDELVEEEMSRNSFENVENEIQRGAMSPKPKSRHSSRLSKGSETNKNTGLRSSAQSANSNNFESSTDSGINKESSLMFKELFDTTNAPNGNKESR